MGFLTQSNTYWEFAGQCTNCGSCRDACPSLTQAGMSLGQIARALLAHDRAAESPEELARAIGRDARLVQAVRGCFFCTSCKNTCFAHNDVCKLIYAARVDFQALGLIPRNAYSSVLVDEEWHIFSAYRAIYGIGYPDLTRHVENDYGPAQTDCALAFFPGCSLSAYAPELTREIFTTLEELGGKTTLIDRCCGSSLKSAGFYDRAEALLNDIADEIAASGAAKVVCVCPGCANALAATFVQRGMATAVQSLPAFLSEHDFQPKHALPEGPLCLSKSCQDRDGSYLAETCKALGLGPDAPAIFHGCCGAGGAVSAFRPARQEAQVQTKLDFAPDGATVVSMCPTCTYTYAFALSSAPRDIANKHYAELLFDSQIDWDTAFAQLGSTWSGPYGPWLASVF